MLQRLGNIFRVPDLRNKVLFTISIICLYQLGANLPIPGVSWSQVQLLQSKAGASGVLGFLNLFSGGALTRLAVFGLGVMPYITSSIVIQLLTTVIPKLTEWRDQGASVKSALPKRRAISPSVWRCCSRPASSTPSTRPRRGAARFQHRL